MHPKLYHKAAEENLYGVVRNREWPKTLSICMTLYTVPVSQGSLEQDGHVDKFVAAMIEG